MRHKGEQGYTLVELIVVMTAFIVVMGLISISFSRIVSSSGQINKAVETEIGGLIGLELFRVDLGLAGFGLPWAIPGAVRYDEAAGGVMVSGCPDDCPNADAARFNDAPNNPPRALLSGDNVGLNGSDYLVLKGTPLGMNSTCQNWSYLGYSSNTAVIKPSKSEVELKPGRSDRVIVVKDVVAGGVENRELVSNGATFSLVFDQPIPSPFCPRSRQDNYLVYGIAPDRRITPGDGSPATSAPIAYPFNRSDYYLSRPDDISSNCAPGTGVLYKTTINQNDSSTVDESNTVTHYPLLDCVADMQVMFLLDSNGDGEVDLHQGDLIGFSAQTIREQLREVRVYILAQHGKKDRQYRYPENGIFVGDPKYRSLGIGSAWDEARLRARFGSDWMHYRWKKYVIAVQPRNLN